MPRGRAKRHCLVKTTKTTAPKPVRGGGIGCASRRRNGSRFFRGRASLPRNRCVATPQPPAAGASRRAPRSTWQAAAHQSVHDASETLGFCPMRPMRRMAGCFCVTA